MSDIKDYGQIFCEAVDQIVKERLNGISYDSTVLCTIIDDSQKDLGLYIVSNGSSKFQAYSSITTYTNDTNVYVQIPQGDWNAQKFIVGKKNKTEVEEAYAYKSPLSSFVDITGNIISVNINEMDGKLVANNKDSENIILWSYNSKDENVLHSFTGPSFFGYSRLGIKAGFRSWVNPYEKGNNVVEGEYGLKLRVKAIKEQIANGKEETTEKSEYYDFILNTNDMNGNALNFQTFFQQEKLFNISDIKEIQEMALVFYQKPDTFKDSKGNLRKYTDDFGGIINHNLFVNNIYISFGYDTSEFNDELVQLYTTQEQTYDRSEEPFENNHREIKLRWIHKEEDGTFVSINENNIPDGNIEIRWYKYKTGAKSADEYSGVYWELLSKQFLSNDEWEYSIENEEWKKHNSQNDYVRYPNFFSSWLLPDVALQNEQVKAIIICDNNQIYRSNVLVFENNDEVVSRPTVDAIQALIINCEDGTYGNYRIYAEGNRLINIADASVKRIFKTYFNSILEDNTNKDNYELIEARNIEWIFPAENSMIKLPDGYEEYFKETGSITEENGVEYWYDIKEKKYHIKRYGNKTENYSIVNTQDYYISGYYSEQYSNNTITCTIEKEPNTFYTATKTLTFGIAGTTGTDSTLVIDFDSASECAIDINSNVAYKFVVNLYDSENKNLMNDDNVDKTGWSIKWGWLNKNNIDVPAYSPENKSVRCPDGILRLNYGDSELKFNQCFVHADEADISEYPWHVLVCELTGYGDYSLVAYYPVPIKQNIGDIKPLYIEGATQIIYNAEGVPSYYKGPYYLYCNDGDRKNDVSWMMSWESADLRQSIDKYLEGEILEENYTEEIQKKVDLAKKYYPSLIYKKGTTQYSLQALNIYVKDNVNNVSVICKDSNNNILWLQPLLIIQNRYPSAMLNQWDGKLKIDEDSNAILSAKVVAGRKNDDEQNTFSGVLMGEVANDIDSGNAIPIYNEDGTQAKDENGNLLYKASTKSTTGLYGFNHGELSFGFRDNGTAFIGKNGSGRIEFDGDTGAIRSSAWREKEIGMFMDLDNGILKLQYSDSKNLSNKYNKANVYSKDDFNNWFQETDTKDKTLFYFFDYKNTKKPETGWDIDKKYYEPFAYEEIIVTNEEYKKLMLQDKTPRFYSYYYTTEFSTKEENNDFNIGENGQIILPDDFQSDILYGDNEIVIVSRVYQYKLLKETDLDNIFNNEKLQEIIGEKTIDYTPEYYTENAKNYIHLYIPSDFSYVPTPKDNVEYYYIKQNITDKNKPTEVIKTTTQYDPTVIYYIENNLDTNEGESNRYITLSAEETLTPLSIGFEKNISTRKFRVDWDGTVHIEDGNFSGIIEAKDGTLGNLRVLGTLSGGIISGAQISGSQIKGSRVEANYLTCYNGEIGGWKIYSNSLRAGQITLDSSSGQIVGGTIKGSTIYSNKGEIGGWIISENTLYGGKRVVTTTESGGTTTNTVTGKYLIELNSKEGSIRGGILRTNYKYNAADGKFTSGQSGGMMLDGYFTIVNPGKSEIGADGSYTAPAPVLGSQFGYIQSSQDTSPLNANGLGMIVGANVQDIKNDTGEIIGQTYTHTSIAGVTGEGVELMYKSNTPIVEGTTKTYLANSVMITGTGISLDTGINSSSTRSTIDLSSNEISLLNISGTTGLSILGIVDAQTVDLKANNVNYVSMDGINDTLNLYTKDSSSKIEMSKTQILIDVGSSSITLPGTLLSNAGGGAEGVSIIEENGDNSSSGHIIIAPSIAIDSEEGPILSTTSFDGRAKDVDGEIAGGASLDNFSSINGIGTVNTKYINIDKGLTVKEGATCSGIYAVLA